MLHQSEALAPLAAVAVEPRATRWLGLPEGAVRRRDRPARQDPRRRRRVPVDARALRKTARNHIEHVYTKIDASSRVAASLFATEHGLL
jgi:hypothetical protein